MGYIWNDDLFAYVDEDTGQPVSEARVRELSETTAQLSRTKTAAIVAAIITAPSLLEVRTQINTELKFSYSRQYMLGRGGRSRMEPSDYQRLGNAIREQYSYLDNFIDAIQADLLSEPQIEHRMNFILGVGTLGVLERTYGELWAAARTPRPSWRRYDVLSSQLQVLVAYRRSRRGRLGSNLEYLTCRELRYVRSSIRGMESATDWTVRSSGRRVWRSSIRLVSSPLDFISVRMLVLFSPDLVER